MSVLKTERPTEQNSAAESWLQEHGDYLFRRALRHVGNQHEAEELVQETLLAALSSQSSFEGRSSERTWLTSILRHKLIDRIRRLSRRPEGAAVTLEDDESLDRLFRNDGHWQEATAPSAWNRSPDKVVHDRQLLMALQNCVSALPEKLRNVFLLREVEDIPSDDICSQLDITPNNLNVILYRARMKLRGCLEQQWGRS